MAATGKKSKKAKWIKTSITSIIAEPTTIATTNNWAEAAEDEPENFGYSSRTRAPVVLPSASRAARGGMAVDDESIPRRPPFIAHISNLPYDVDESAISDLFAGLKITNLRLPREGDRLKGYGYVDFEDRESLIDAMNMPDLTVGGRRIRIEVSTQDNDRRMGRGGGRSDRERDYDPERTMGDWRSGPRAVPEPQRARNPERDMHRDAHREREPSAETRPGAWRDGGGAEPARAPYGGRDSFGRDRYGDDRARDRGYGGRDGFRTAERDGGGFGNRDRDGGSRGFGGRGFGDRDRERDMPPRESDGKPRERPKLNLLPRTVPRDAETPTKPADGAALDDKPDKAAPKPVSAEKVFGAAKPVDTAAKEREIEERLRKQEEEARRGTDDKERWGRRNDHSGDRRAGARRDDRGRDTRDTRDSRSFNRDRRDYSKDDKDRREYNRDDRRDYRDDRDRRDRDDRDRRDYRDDRERRDYRDDRDRRDYRDDNRDRRDYSPDRTERRDYRDDREERRDYSGERRGSRDRDSRDGRDSRDTRDSRDARDTRDARDSRDVRDTRDSRDSRGARDERDDSRERRPDSRGRDERDERNGRARHSRERERRDDDQPEDTPPMPKLKEQEKPVFVASNKFSFLDADDDVGSD